MIITKANVDQYPWLPADIIRDIKLGYIVYDTETNEKLVRIEINCGVGLGACVRDKTSVVENPSSTEKITITLPEYNLPWSSIPTLANSDSDKEISPTKGGPNNDGVSPFNPNTKFTVNKPQKPVIISSNNNKLSTSSNSKELATNKGVMHFNGVVIEQLETFKKKYFLTKEAVNLIQDKLIESVISLYSKENSIDDNKVNSINFMEFSEFDNNSFNEFDLMSTIPAENLINNPDLMSGKLNEIAKNSGTVNVNARMAVIKDNNKAIATLTRTDDVLVSKEVPVYPANYIGNGYFVDIRNLGIEYVLMPVNSYSGLGLQGNIIQKYSNENKKFSYPEKVELPNKVENKRIEVPYPHQFNDAIIVFPRNSNLPPLYAYSGFPAIELKDKDPRPQQEQEFNEIKSGVKFTSDFYKEVFNAYGDKAEKLAKELASQVKGKTIRNVDDALKAYNKYKANINKRINAKDREAIVKALESIKVSEIASNLKKFSNSMLYVSKFIDAADLFNELLKAVKTDNWRPFFVKVETLVAGAGATAIVGFTFSVLFGGPVGILGYGLIIAGVGALIDDNLVEEANKLIGI